MHAKCMIYHSVRAPAKSYLLEGEWDIHGKYLRCFSHAKALKVVPSPADWHSTQRQDRRAHSIRIILKP